MRELPTAIGLCCFLGMNAGATAVESEPCDRIREQIQARTGIPDRPDTKLLRKIAARPDCGFSAAEVYRAAWGDKPMPKNDTRSRHHNRHRDDD